MHDLARLRVAEVEVVVAAAVADLVDRDPAAVGRDGFDAAVAAELEDPLVAGLEVAGDDVEVDAVAAVRRVREEPRRRVRGVAMDEARVDDERLELPRPST